MGRNGRDSCERAYIRAVPVTDSRDRISGAKNETRLPRAPEEEPRAWSPEREFLNPDGAM